MHRTQWDATIHALLLLLLLLIPLVSAKSSSSSSPNYFLSAAAAAYHSNDIALALSHSLAAWRAGRVCEAQCAGGGVCDSECVGGGGGCEGLRMALWMTHGSEPPGGVLEFVARCDGAADAGEVWGLGCNLDCHKT
jgi:hypothetical protein